jgi:glycosyltransferase involved in cell wall biosynthesis
MNQVLKIAFVQDAMLFQGGSDKFVAAALEVFPQAPIYTLVHDPEPYRGTVFEHHPIHVSLLNRLPGAREHHRMYLPLMPLALDQFDLRGYDVVVSFSYAVAHAAPTRPGQLHISYIHTPMRYAWRPRLVSQISPGSGRLPVRLAETFLSLFRRWDASMARRTDHFIANSQSTADLIARAYGRTAQVLYPPVDTAAFQPLQPRLPYYIAVSRLVGHKRLDLVVQAFNQLGLPLLVVGQGPDEGRLRSSAGSNVNFLGWQKQENLARLLGQAKAFVHAGEEDFGIAIAEAQAAGCPVIAYRRGGSAEIVADGRTGLLFTEQSADCLAETVTRFERDGVSDPPGQIQPSAGRFTRELFKQSFTTTVMERWAEFEAARPVASFQPATTSGFPGD